MARKCPRFRQQYDNEWTLIYDWMLVGCCDCGLVHKVHFAMRPYKGNLRVWWKVVRCKKMTVALRKKKGVKVVKC